MARRRKGALQSQIDEIAARWNEIEAGVAELDAAVRSLPAGAERNRLVAELNQVKRDLGLMPEPPPGPRELWTWDRWEARAIQLKAESKAWRRAGQTERADACLREGRAAAERARVLRAPIAKS